MTLIEGIGDEVTHFFIGLTVIIVASLAWWTTSISEHRHVQTVLLLERRRHRPHRRLTNHTHTVTIAEGTVVASSAPSEVPAVTSESMETASKPPEASTSTSETGVPEERSGDEEQIRIIERMDADSCVLRQRRLAFYERSNNGEVGENSSEIASNSDPQTTSSACSDAEATIMEHNYAEKATDPTNFDNATANQLNTNVESARSANDIRIKLKYINDDLRLVDGKLQELLGDFKKRHFQGELSSNKMVRLIFNGQVLHQDSKTLEGCGLFDNCVVHCLVHQRRPVPGEENHSNLRGESTATNHNRNLTANNNNNQGRDWDLGNFLFAIISFTLLSAWYFRYVYAHLYTVTATVGLILMTGVFTIILFGFYFPETDHVPQRMENQPRAQS